MSATRQVDSNSLDFRPAIRVILRAVVALHHIPG